MRLLLIDTCGSEGSVALADTERNPAVISSERLPGRSSSERLMPAIRGAMETAGWKLKDLTAIVAVSGPGSFTGVRVGLSAAKGLSEAGGVPLVAVSRLALLAGLAGGGDEREFQLRERTRQGSRICAVLDAGRGEFYVGDYDGRQVVREALMDRAELESAVGHCSLVACEKTVADSLAGLRPRMVREPVAEDALAIAVERICRGEFDDVATVDANYLRRTDAQIFAKPKGKTS